MASIHARLLTAVVRTGCGYAGYRAKVPSRPVRLVVKEAAIKAQ